MLLDMSAYGIGNTPLVELDSVHGNRMLVKLEKKNFLGSIKARSGYWMIRELPAEAVGKTIVESSSGNLGLALGYFCQIEKRDFLCLVDIILPARLCTGLTEQTSGALGFSGLGR